MGGVTGWVGVLSDGYALISIGMIISLNGPGRRNLPNSERPLSHSCVRVVCQLASCPGQCISIIDRDCEYTKDV